MIDNTLTDAGRASLDWARRFMERHEPEQHAHLARVAHRIIVDPALCGAGAWGCVRSDHPWTIILGRPPESMPCIELLLTLAHEGFHIRPGPQGQFWIFPHRCSDSACSNPYERAVDPVYGIERVLRPRIEAALRAEGLDPLKPPPLPAALRRTPRSPWRIALEAAALTAGVVLVATVVTKAVKS